MGCVFSKNKHHPHNVPLQFHSYTAHSQSFKETKQLEKDLQGLEKTSRNVARDVKKAAINKSFFVKEGPWNQLEEHLQELCLKKRPESGDENNNHGADFPVNYWEKGTGFGHDDAYQTGVDPKLLNAKEDLVLRVFVVLDVLVAKLLESRNNGTCSEFLRHAEKSPVPKILESYLSNDSLLDIFSHIPLYRVLISILANLAKQPVLRRLVFVYDDGVLYSRFKNIAEGASDYLDGISKLKQQRSDKQIADANAFAMEINQTAKRFVKYSKSVKKEKGLQKTASDKTEEESNKPEENAKEHSKESDTVDKKHKKKRRRKKPRRSESVPKQRQSRSNAKPKRKRNKRRRTERMEI